MSNLSVLDWNIIHGLGEEDAYLRLRDRHSPIEAERRAYLVRDTIRPLLAMAAETHRLGDIPAGLERFFVERLAYMESIK